MFLCALVGPRAPRLPRPASSLCPSCVSARPAVVFFFWCSRSLLLARALHVTFALLRVTLVPLPCAPSLACLPSQSHSRSRPCLHVYPPCPCIAVTRLCHSCALPLPLPLAPTLSPGCSLSPRLPPLPDCRAPCVGGGGGLNWSGVYPPLCSSRVCLTNLFAYSDPCLSVSRRQFVPSLVPGWGKSRAASSGFRALSPSDRGWGVAFDVSHVGFLLRTGMLACAGSPRSHTCVSGSPGLEGWGGRSHPCGPLPPALGYLGP